MNVIISDVPSVNLKTFPLANGFENSPEFLFNVVICENLAAVFGGPDQMILANVCAVVQLIESRIFAGLHKATSFLALGVALLYQELTL